MTKPTKEQIFLIFFSIVSISTVVGIIAITIGFTLGGAVHNKFNKTKIKIREANAVTYGVCKTIKQVRIDKVKKDLEKSDLIKSPDPNNPSTMIEDQEKKKILENILNQINLSDEIKTKTITEINNDLGVKIPADTLNFNCDTYLDKFSALFK